MMMHTFIGEDAQAVLEKLRIPLTKYLKSHLNLIESGAQSLNLQVDLKQKDAETYRDQLAAFAFERYYRSHWITLSMRRSGISHIMAVRV